MFDGSSDNENGQTPLTMDSLLYYYMKTKRSWKDLQYAVRTSRSVQQKLINRIPSNFTFSGDRLYFLAVPPNSRENTIHYVDIPGHGASCVGECLEWQPLLDINRPFVGYSKEEQLMRERKRLGSFGITSYDYCNMSRRFLFSSSNSLHTFIDIGKDKENCQLPFSVHEVPSQTNDTKMDSKLCPINSNLAAFIHHNDIWVTNLETGQELRLTHSNNGSTNPIEETTSSGVASFVAQEEFDRYTGYWWQPQCFIDENKTISYKILYEEVDESNVEVLNIVASPEGATQISSVDSYRYPKAGSSNATSKMKIVEFAIDQSGQMCDTVMVYQLMVPLDEIFPNMEYVVRAGWLPDGQSVWVQLLSRNQQHMTMVQIPLACFSHIVPSEFDLISSSDSLPLMKVIAEDTTDIWINLSDIVYFLKNATSETQFIWSSESSGHRHLYLATVNSRHVMSRGRSRSFLGQNSVYYPLVTQQQLTDGDWEVDGKQIWVDESRKLVYFMATKETPLEQHLYVVSYDDRVEKTIQRLTEPGAYHTITMNEDFTKFVSLSSSVNETHKAVVYQIDNDEVSVNNIPMVTIEPIATLLKSEAIGAESCPPEIFSYQSKQGHQAYGLICKPLNFDPGEKYPTILYVYGGPQVQLVTNSYKGVRFLRLHTLAMLGYVVVVIDSRGSSRRGLHFEGHIKNRMGKVEIEDQVEGLEYIAKTTNCIDMSRVAIHGWSYGGYLSLFGLIQRPDIFKVAIAGAPVTTWEAYDTGYTERYMWIPQENSRAYMMSSVLSYVNSFPDEENRLLLVHGLIDENVHFTHTSLLINELVKACKPYRLIIYPNERHGIRQTVSSEHYETSMLSFLQNNL
ncbi:dipeptidyl peptidase 9-like [Actinia tenebrosa]|uniref:Dipeptidyl peptidase 9-like n=1 Tax=Actinia tenebrosa TaxID=6105 RepID=A0A6P8HXP1_ACTTE|nr:dipeptidyl peptidase 9-like [Actinia tenebrosa]